MIKFYHSEIHPDILPICEHRIGLEISEISRCEFIITIYHKYETIQKGKTVCVIDTETSFASNRKDIEDMVFLALKAIDFTTAILSVESSRVYPKSIPVDYPDENYLMNIIEKQLNRLN